VGTVLQTVPCNVAICALAFRLTTFGTYRAQRNLA
jgi:hypothetical protein